jgi:hypothetical protein
MSSTAKVSVAIGRKELAWAKSRARSEGKSLSTLVTESLAERRRLAALAEVVEWMGKGQPALSAEELASALREIGASTMGQASSPRRRRSAARASNTPGRR